MSSNGIVSLNSLSNDIDLNNNHLNNHLNNIILKKNL